MKKRINKLVIIPILLIGIILSVIFITNKNNSQELSNAFKANPNEVQKATEYSIVESIDNHPTLTIGVTKTYTAVIPDGVTPSTVSWSCTNISTATCSGTGTSISIQGIGAGNSKLRGKIGDTQVAEFDVTVVAGSINVGNISADDHLTITVGQTYQLQATTNPSGRTISYSSKESIKFRKIHPLKKEENKKIENNIEINNIKNNNIINNKDIKKENNKIIYNNENKNLKFDKKRKMMPELNSIDYIKFNRIKNNLHYKNNNNVVNENNEKIKVNNLNMRTKYSFRYYKYKNKNNNNEIKEKKDNILNEEKNKKINILEKIEKDNKMKENDSQKKGSNITYDNNRVYKFKDYNKNDNISYSNKNDSSKILSLIKKCNRRSMHINLNNPNNKKINIENNDNNEKIEKESNLYYNTEKKGDIHIKSTSTTNTRNKTKNSFNFLIHQAHENSNLSDTFSKIYESYMN